MSTTNGVLQPPQSGPSLSRSPPGKRKRESDEVSQGDGVGASGPPNKVQLDQTIREIFYVLRRYDSDCLLQHPLPLRSSTEPETKRARLSGDASEASSIESRITSGEYNSTQELVNDIESASNLVIEQHRQRNDATANGYNPPDQAKTGTDIVNRIAVFKKHLDNLLRRTSSKDISQVKSEPQGGISETSDNGDLKRTYPQKEGRTVLTLYGNSANPKQMFSSLKRPARVNLQPPDSEAVTSVEIKTSLNESKLPNGISATKVIPYNDVDSKGKNITKTIGQIFPPRSSLPQLEPPRKGKQAQKSSAMTWADWFDVAADSKALPNERGSYNLSVLPSGQWLHYGAAPKSSSNQTPQEHGDPQQPDSTSQRELADDNSLFQSAYSSFAPSFDSSGAIIPEDSKDQMWWNKFGEKRFRALLSLQYPEEELTGNTPDDNATVPQGLDEDTLEEAVNSYIEENEFPDLAKPNDDSGRMEDKDMEEVLNEIGELLETLNSYNRLRNLVPPGSRPGNEATPGTPDTPSTAEVTVYETLKASLSAMVATLPPYAVAKLNGEQLSDLNISQRMLVENADYHGTMEVDDYTAQQRFTSRIPPPSAAAGRTSGMAAGSRSNNYQSPAASSHFNQRQISTNSRSQTPRGYPPQQAYGARQTQSNHYAPNIAPQNYQTPRQPISTPQRPTHGTPKYPQSASSQYGSHGSTLQQFQRSSQNGVGRYSPQQGHLPAHSSSQQYQQRPNQPGYPQRASERPYNTPLVAGRSASPQKPPNYTTPQPHSPYMNTNPSAQQQYIHPQQQQPHHQIPQQPHQLHHYNNFPPSRTPPVPNHVPNSATIAATMPYQRSAAEQAALMDRNKTQLDMNQHRQSSITPQPSQTMSPLLASAQPRRESMQGISHTPGNQQNGMTNMNPSGSH